MNQLPAYFQLAWENILKEPLTDSRIFSCLICLAFGHFLSVRIIITAFLTYAASIGYMINQRRVNSLKEQRLWSLVFRDYKWLDAKVKKGLQPILVANPALHEIFFLLRGTKDNPEDFHDESIDSESGKGIPGRIGKPEPKFTEFYNSLNGHRDGDKVYVQDDIIQWTVRIPGIPNTDNQTALSWATLSKAVNSGVISCYYKHTNPVKISKIPRLKETGPTFLQSFFPAPQYLHE